MLFSSMIFLWGFLPFVFIIYILLNNKFKNLFLVLASLFFYAWGEPVYVILMILSVLLNYFMGLLIDHHKQIFHRRLYLILCITINLVLLAYFKYFNFFIKGINMIFGSEVSELKNMLLPIGISFYTFQSLSYIIDVYKREVPVQKKILELALYISLFPQLIAGPIVKYCDIQSQFEEHHLSSNKIAYGIKRFIYGLSKKVILANCFAQVVDKIFSHNTASLGTMTVWFGMLLYTLQIYYDFSGYSDMAIGLGKIFGFDFLENFNYPYISKSIQEFWRRWHISLSTWFKDYIYIPLGGGYKGKVCQYINILIVFTLTGLWHGASFNFIVWGLYHCFFLSLEKWFLGKWLKKTKFKGINHIYTVFVVLIGWVFFRAESLNHALHLLQIFIVPQTGRMSICDFLSKKLILLLFFGIIFSGILQLCSEKLSIALYNEKHTYWMENIVLFFLLFVCIMFLINNTYNPFIYFRF